MLALREIRRASCAEWEARASPAAREANRARLTETGFEEESKGKLYRAGGSCEPCGIVKMASLPLLTIRINRLKSSSPSTVSILQTTIPRNPVR